MNVTQNLSKMQNRGIVERHMREKGVLVETQAGEIKKVSASETRDLLGKPKAKGGVTGKGLPSSVSGQANIERPTTLDAKQKSSTRSLGFDLMPSRADLAERGTGILKTNYATKPVGTAASKPVKPAATKPVRKPAEKPAKRKMGSAPIGSRPLRQKPATAKASSKPVESEFSDSYHKMLADKVNQATTKRKEIEAAIKKEMNKSK